MRTVNEIGAPDVTANGENDNDGWSDWIVVPGSGFRVKDDQGQVEVAQIDKTRFSVKTEFVFDHPDTIEAYVSQLAERLPEDQARSMVEDARTFRHVPSVTDFASVPQFLGWFERSYGCHTLAAILHDQLIVDKVNGGALGSDTLADSFFRDMIGASGVPTLKRWLMWAAVAARTRWARGGRRRVLLIIWGLLGVLGIGSAALALFQAVTGDLELATAAARVGMSFALGVAASALWGRQWGAGLVAAITGIWLIPATVFVVIGLAVYWLMEKLAG